MNEDPWEKRERERQARQHAVSQRAAEQETDRRTVSEITRGIMSDLMARDLKGQSEYGQTMDREDLTAMEWLDHEYSEILDAAQYNRAARRKVEEMGREIEGYRQY